jgi:hypothetical protein
VVVAQRDFTAVYCGEKIKTERIAILALVQMFCKS